MPEKLPGLTSEEAAEYRIIVDRANANPDSKHRATWNYQLNLLDKLNAARVRAATVEKEDAALPWEVCRKRMHPTKEQAIVGDDVELVVVRCRGKEEADRILERIYAGNRVVYKVRERGSK